MGKLVKEKCPVCKGEKEVAPLCSTCLGRGYTDQKPNGCCDCGGSGKATTKIPCKFCEGTGLHIKQIRVLHLNT